MPVRQDEPIAGDGREALVTLGRIVGPYGVRGWVRLHSDTQPMENILRYNPWWLRIDGRWQSREVLAGRTQGKGVIAGLAGCLDRDQAVALRGVLIAVRRWQLPAIETPGSYYWTDLQGLEVITLAGESLGRISRLMETGANDVLVVQGERERLVPYIWEQVVKQVDLDRGTMLVDWDPEF